MPPDRSSKWMEVLNCIISVVHRQLFQNQHPMRAEVPIESRRFSDQNIPELI